MTPDLRFGFFLAFCGSSNGCVLNDKDGKWVVYSWGFIQFWIPRIINTIKMISCITNENSVDISHWSIRYTLLHVRKLIIDCMESYIFWYKKIISNSRKFSLWFQEIAIIFPVAVPFMTLKSKTDSCCLPRQNTGSIAVLLWTVGFRQCWHCEILFWQDCIIHVVFLLECLHRKSSV